MGKFPSAPLIAAAFLMTFTAAPAWAQVIITPLGSVTGEFCRADRALILEDPTGTRVLYDPGRTVAGGTDPRLGDIDIILLSSVHSDHIGTEKMTQDPDTATNCGSNPARTAAPNSNLAEIAAAKDAEVIVGGEMRDFIRTLVAAEGGNPSKVDVLRHGGKKTIGNVTIAVVRGDHSNGVPRELLSRRHVNDLVKDGLTAYVGPENGYVLTFSNGLVVYLSGDTGHTSDMATIVKGYYGATVAVVNMGDKFSMGPEEAAFAITDLIEAVTAIPSHANQESTSGGGAVVGTSRVQTFINEVGVNADVIVPLSGTTITCDGAGGCTQP